MKFAFKNLILVLFTVVVSLSATSCLDSTSSNNYQSFSELVGTIVNVNSTKLFRWDQNGTLLYTSDLLSSDYPIGSRVLLSGTIDYNEQNKDSIFLVIKATEIKKINLKQTFSFDAIEKDTFKNDVILGQTWSYIVYANSKFYYTTRTIFYASNQYHSFDLVNNRVNLNDTLKFEIRHNSKLDSEKSIQEMNLSSFDMTPYLDTIPPGKSKILQISYKTSSGVIKQNITFKYGE